jgi:diguanylate cyclase (GGDEF)-like protein
MSLKNEFFTKTTVYIVAFVSLAILYFSISTNQTIFILSIVNIVFILIWLYIYNKDLKKKFIINSLYDTQTKLYNRQYFLAELTTTHERAMRYGSALSLMMITIKNINDFSKKEQLVILKEIGIALLKHTRQSDIVCRYDDDKIAILLPMTDYLHASIAKDRLKNNLLTLTIDNVDKKLDLVFTAIECQEDETADEFLVRCIEKDIIEED